MQLGITKIMLMMNQVLGFGAGAGVSGIIESIQQISITIAGGTSSNTATITSVDTSRSLLLYNGQTTALTGDTEGEQFGGPITSVRGGLTNATTVTATRGGTSATPVTAYYTVVQFKSGATTQIQKGTIALSAATSNTATITSVDTSRSVAFHNGWSTATASRGTTPGTIVLTNATTVTAQVNGASNITVAYTVVEFSSSVVESVQQLSKGLTTSSSDTSTITSVDTSRTMVIWNGYRCTNNGGSIRQYLFKHTLTNATTVTYDTFISAPGSTLTYATTVIQFRAGVVKSLQRNSSSTMNSAPKNDTITTVDTTKTISNMCGFQTTDNNVADSSKFWIASRINSSTQHQLLIGDATGEIIASWEAVEFV